MSHYSDILMTKIRQFKGTVGVRCKGVLSACTLVRTSGCCWHALSPIGFDQIGVINNVFGYQHWLACSTHQHHCLDRAADWGIWKPACFCSLDCSTVSSIPQQMWAPEQRNETMNQCKISYSSLECSSSGHLLNSNSRVVLISPTNQE